MIAVQCALIPFFTRVLPFLSQASFDNAAWAGSAPIRITLG
jgi:hypothetical protein